MSDPLTTSHLKLPYLAAAQAQKHVTHNEALTLLDMAVQLAVLDASLTAPPGSPAEGDRYIVAAGATGAWAGKDGEVATWVDGAWIFATPETGWLAFDVATSALLVFLSGTWQTATAAPTAAAIFGINTTADTTNRLSVRSAAALFSGIAAADGGTGDMRVIIDKEADGDTASLLFQSGWSGRAEIGLAGDTDLVVKVSADGSTWTEAIRINKTTGRATILYDHSTSGLTATNVQAAIDEIAASGGVGGAVASVFGRTGAVAAAASDYDASQVDNDSGVSGATVKAALDTLSTGKQAANTSLTAIAGLSPANDDILQRKAGAWTNRTPAQVKADLAITASDIVAAVSNTELGYLDGVTSAVQTQIDGKAPLASPALTGTPTAPTATVDTNTTQVATTAFVLAQGSVSGDGTPAMDGTAARGTSTHFARADHIHPTDTSRAPLASPAFTGMVTLPGDPASALQAATKQYVDNVAAGLNPKANVKAATTVNITLSGAQTIDGVSIGAGDRVLVKDQSTASQNGIYVAAAGAWSRATDMDAWVEVPGANTWVQQGTANADKAWVCTADDGGTLGTTAITWVQFGGTGVFAPLNAPALTGTPTAPTAAIDTNTTQLATTAFVLGQASASGDGTPAMDGTASRGTSTHFARADHVHPADTSRAPLASPTFTGTPAAPTATAGTNTTQLATTAFVAAAVAALSTVYQAIATILTAIASLGTTGLITRTGAGTVATRTITGTTGKVTVTNGDGVSGDPTLTVGSSVALLDAAAQSLSGGARVVTYDNGTKSSGTLTPDPGNGPHQKYTNNGAHTLAPGANYGSYWLDVTNGASAGAIATSGWTKVTGDSFTTTNANKFACAAHISEVGSLLFVQAMQ